MAILSTDFADSTAFGTTVSTNGVDFLNFDSFGNPLVDGFGSGTRTAGESGDETANHRTGSFTSGDASMSGFFGGSFHAVGSGLLGTAWTMNGLIMDFSNIGPFTPSASLVVTSTAGLVLNTFAGDTWMSGAINSVSYFESDGISYNFEYDFSGAITFTNTPDTNPTISVKQIHIHSEDDILGDDIVKDGTIGSTAGFSVVLHDATPPTFTGKINSIDITIDGQHLVASGFSVDASELFAAGQDTMNTAANFDTLFSHILSGNDVITGTSDGGQTLKGYAGNDNIFGGGNGDSIDGGAGHDTLTSASSEGGSSTLSGGAGNDLLHTTLYMGDPFNASITDNVSGGDGIDTLVLHGFDWGMTTYVGFSTIDSGIENVDGSDAGNGAYADFEGGTENNNFIGTAGSDYLAGNDGNDTLVGGDGSDQLLGGAGNDSEVGGLGGDTYNVDNVGDKTGAESADEEGGYDTVYSSAATWTLGANYEELDLQDSGNINGIGNAGDNLINGNSGNNSLAGMAGNDTINADAGNDSVDGGTGNDNIDGGEGNDVLAGGDGNDQITDIGGGNNTISGGAGDDSITINTATDSVAGGAGIDAVTYTSSEGTVTLEGTTENLVVSNGEGVTGVGNALANSFTSNFGYNSFNGKGGNDTYNLTVGDTAAEDSSGGGTDLVVFSGTGGFTLGNGIENLTYLATGSSENGGVGNGLNNVLTRGDAYTASLDGLLGNDTYNIFGDDYVAEANDTAHGGTDLANVFLSDTQSYTLNTGIENLTLFDISEGTLTGNGNALNNVITGASSEGAINILNGGLGNDTITGGGGNDTIDGGEGADVLSGAGGDDSMNAGGSTSATMSGGAGEDYLLGGSGNDSIDGGADNDAILAYGGNNTVAGGDGDDAMGAGDGANSMSGGAGDDNIYAGFGNDTLDGGAGDDSIDGGEGSDQMMGSAGNDNLYGYGGNDKLDGGDGNDNLYGGNGADSLVGGNGDDWLDGNYDGSTDTLIGGAGNDGIARYVLTDGVGNNTLVGASMDGGTGIDTVWLQGVGPDSIDGTLTLDMGTAAGFANIENLNAGEGLQNINYAITGNALNNYIEGNNGNDVLLGKGGNDTLVGAGGNDLLHGGAGNDYYVLDGSDGQAISDLESVASGGAGTGDIVELSNTAGNFDLNSSMFGGIEGLVLFANESNNSITGTTGANFLASRGAQYNATLAGGLGNDTYGVHIGSDNSFGGADVIQGENTAGGGGTDSVIAYLLNGQSWDLGAGSGLENLTLVDVDIATTLTGSGNELNNVITGANNPGAFNNLSGGGGNDTLIGGASGNNLYGDAGNDKLVGGAGDDSLDGGEGGSDTLIGGLGDDTYKVDLKALAAGAPEDSITEAANGGYDVVTFYGNNAVTGFNYNAGTANIEEVYIHGEGSSFNATLVGGAAQNYFVSSRGNDKLDGGAGDDHLDGGEGGNDTLLGGLGDDFLNGGDNTGPNSNNNSMDGGAGNDTYSNGAGNDTMVIAQAGDQVQDNFGGTDTLLVSVIPTQFMGEGGPHPDREIHLETGVGSGIENVTFTGTGAVAIFGGDAFNSFTGAAGNDTLDGGEGGDTLVGGLGDDSLYGGYTTNPLQFGDNLDGGKGNDSLDGGEGGDTMTGGDGNDVIVGGESNEGSGINDGDDQLDGGAGNDTLYGGTPDDSGSYSGRDSLVGGTGDDQLFGGDQRDTLMGGDGKDKLDGGEGGDALFGGAGDDTLDAGSNGADGYNDQLDGGAGNDTYIVYENGDQIVNESVAGGTADTVIDRASSYTLGANVERVIFDGEGGQSLTANASNNSITGGSSHDTIDGAAGNDTITGGDGNDQITGGDGNDRLDGGEGDNFITGGAGNDSITGGNDNNFLQGDAGNDTLVSGSDSDVLFGGTGNDSMNGGAGSDTLWSGGGKDTMVGGDGTDYFVLGGSTIADAVLIKDFHQMDGEQIGLDATAFAGLYADSMIGANDITNGTVANNGGNAQLIYTFSTGKLYYDADGVGGNAQVLIATFDAASKPLELHSGDFFNPSV